MKYKMYIRSPHKVYMRCVGSPCRSCVSCSQLVFLSRLAKAGVVFAFVSIDGGKFSFVTSSIYPSFPLSIRSLLESIPSIATPLSTPCFISSSDSMTRVISVRFVASLSVEVSSRPRLGCWA